MEQKKELRGGVRPGAGRPLAVKTVNMSFRVPEHLKEAFRLAGNELLAALKNK